MKYKFTFFYLTLLLLPVLSHAQLSSSLHFGMNFSSYTHHLGNLENAVYAFNYAHPEYDKLYKFPALEKGPLFGVSVGSRARFEAVWKNAHAILRAEGPPTGMTENWKREVKYRLNTFSLGYSQALNEKEAVKFHISMDFGSFTIVKRIGPESSFSDSSFVALYDKESTGVFGMTLGVSYTLQPGSPLSLTFKPYFQPVACNPFKYHKNGDSDPTKYYYNVSNFGLAVYLSFTRKDD